VVVDHIGIVVRCLEEGITQWVSLFGYAKASDIVVNTRQKVRVVFLAKPNSLTVKLIEPTDSSSPVAAFAHKGGLHHLCFRCDDLAVAVPALQAKGAVLLVRPEPGEAFGNNPIAFLMARNNLNLELIDTGHKQGWQSQPVGADVRRL
jgi:methylmalonyl-CoA/ethylmalonyl-CoA epimerase